jgi:hypothetical protein
MLRHELDELVHRLENQQQQNERKQRIHGCRPLWGFFLFGHSRRAEYK